MTFIAGNVEAILGAKVNPAGFLAYDRAVSKAGASAAKAEAASTAAARSMNRAGAASNSAAAGVSKFGGAAGTAAAVGVAALAVGLKEVVSAAAGFEQQMDRVKAVTKANKTEMRQMGDAARELGKKTGLGATTAASALEALAKGGLTTKQIIDGGLAGALALAQAGSMDVAAAAEATANALNLFGLEGKQATHVADALAVAANDTTADVSDFALALTQGGSAAKIAGLSFDETVVALEALAKIGVKGSDAGTSLKAALLQVIDPTKEASKVMKQYGIDFTDSTGKIKPLGDVADMLKEKLGGLSREQQTAALKAMAGTDGFRSLAALMEQGGEGTDKLSSGLKQTGEAARVAKENTDNLRGSWDKFKAQLQDVAIQLGTPMLDGLTGGLNEATRLIDDASKNEGLKQFVADLGDMAEAAGDAVDALIDLGKASGVGQALEGLGRVFSGLVEGFKALVAGDLGGLWDGMVKSAGGAARLVLAPFAALARALPQPFKDAISTIVGLFTTMLGAVSSTFSAMSGLPVIGGQFKGIADAIDNARDSMDDFRDSLDETKAPKINLNDSLRALQEIQGTKIEPKVMKILANDRPATEKIDALIALGIPPKTARLLANIAHLLNGVKDAKSAIATVQSKTILINAAGNALSQVQAIAAALSNISGGATVPIRPRGGPRTRAAGRGPVGPETALVGEGRHAREAVVSPAGGWSMVTSGPTLMNLPADAYVIPEDPMQRGRSMGLLQALAGDLGLQGFKTGKKGKSSKKPAKRYVPDKLEPLRLPLSEIDRRASSAEQARDDAERRYRALRDTAGEKYSDGKNKGKPTKAAREAKSKLAAARKKWDRLKADAKQRQSEARQAAAFQSKIELQEKIADRAASDMALADKRNDSGGYNKASITRNSALEARKVLLEKVQGILAKLGGKYATGEWAQTVGKEIADLTLDLETPAASAEAERLADTGMTDAERGRLAEIERDVALAALTSGLEDDRAAEQSRLSLLEGVLGQAGARGLSPETVKGLAEAVGSARSNLQSLTGNGSNDNADLQAQIDQQRARADREAENSRINAAALSAFTGSGDVGFGRNVTVNFPSVVPYSPEQAQRVAGIAASGFGYQRPVGSPRLSVG